MSGVGEDGLNPGAVSDWRLSWGPGRLPQRHELGRVFDLTGVAQPQRTVSEAHPDNHDVSRDDTNWPSRS
jgi:hypothetical protein